MRIPIIMTGALMAAACSGSNSIQAGQWERTTTLTPESIGVATTMTDSFCLAPEQAGQPSAEAILGSLPQGCSYENFEMAAGRIQAAARCGDGASAPAPVTGKFSSTSYEASVELQETALGAQAVRIEASRKGNC